MTKDELIQNKIKQTQDQLQQQAETKQNQNTRRITKTLN